jgi:hypothetical protein
MATGFAFHTHLAFALFHPFAQVNKFEDLLQRESQLLHKYDEQAAHPESFQRISNLSGIGTQVKWQSYLYKNVLKRVYVIVIKYLTIFTLLNALEDAAECDLSHYMKAVLSM